jgi:hypothetical protein
MGAESDYHVIHAEKMDCPCQESNLRSRVPYVLPSDGPSLPRDADVLYPAPTRCHVEYPWPLDILGILFFLLKREISSLRSILETLYTKNIEKEEVPRVR